MAFRIVNRCDPILCKNQSNSDKNHPENIGPGEPKLRNIIREATDQKKKQKRKSIKAHF